MDTNHGGSNLDADHPQQGVNVPRLTTAGGLHRRRHRRHSIGLGANSEFIGQAARAELDPATDEVSAMGGLTVARAAGLRPPGAGAG